MLFFVVLGLGAMGCSGGPPNPDESASRNGPAAVKPASETPEALLHEQIRSGMFQMAAAAGSIEESLAAAKEALAKLSASGRPVMAEALELIDSAGAEVAEFAEDPPERAAIEKEFAFWDDRRLKAVEAGNDAMHDLREASGALADLVETEPSAGSKIAGEVRALVLVALDDLWGAVEAFGGKPETEDPPIAP